ncbi:hypothetical protein C6Q14_15850 [Burkholderia ambifaria]|jgi:hypothetical protein|nr:hypothetical protein C6Q14_15850 [Burkholderia ambifaria]
MAIVYSDAIRMAAVVSRLVRIGRRATSRVDAMSRLVVHVTRRVGRAEESRHRGGFARTRMRGRR